LPGSSFIISPEVTICRNGNPENNLKEHDMDIKTVTTAAIAFVLSTGANASTIVINEFLPNAVGTDTGKEWIEIFNNTTNPIDISGWEIQKATSSYSTIFTFAGGTSLPAGEHMVIGGANVTGADFTIAKLGLGNAGSSSDAIRLIDALATVIDTVIYGPNNNDGFLNDLGIIAFSFADKPFEGQSLGRLFDGMDTGASGIDFERHEIPTPGFSNSVSAVPVPAAAWLFGSGLLGLVGVSRRNS